MTLTLLLRRLLLTGLVAAATATLVCVGRGRTERRHSESLLEKGLEDTFPASDPTATQDFAIPANRA